MSGSNIQPPFRPGTSQVKAYTGTAGVVDNAFGSQTYVVRVWCSTAAYIAFGASPTATTSDIPIPANTPEYFIVTPGQKVSAVQQSSGGNLNVTEMTR